MADSYFANWGERLKSGLAWCNFPWRTWNRIINVLEGISIRGGHIDKTADGRGWEIVPGGAEGTGFTGTKYVITTVWWADEGALMRTRAQVTFENGLVTSWVDDVAPTTIITAEECDPQTPTE